MNKKLGTIISFDGGWGSGLATLVLEDETGEREIIYCDNGPTIRSFAACFSNEQVILPNHCVNVAVLRGKQIEYQCDPFGILEWFAPIESEIEI